MYSTNNQFRDGPSRNVDTSKSEGELTINIKKATSAEESAPKRKHVRACIVYTWLVSSNSETPRMRAHTVGITNQVNRSGPA